MTNNNNTNYVLVDINELVKHIDRDYLLSILPSDVVLSTNNKDMFDIRLTNSSCTKAFAFGNV